MSGARLRGGWVTELPEKRKSDDITPASVPAPGVDGCPDEAADAKAEELRRKQEKLAAWKKRAQAVTVVPTVLHIDKPIVMAPRKKKVLRVGSQAEPPERTGQSALPLPEELTDAAGPAAEDGDLTSVSLSLDDFPPPSAARLPRSGAVTLADVAKATADVTHVDDESEERFRAEFMEQLRRRHEEEEAEEEARAAPEAGATSDVIDDVTHDADAEELSLYRGEEWEGAPTTAIGFAAVDVVTERMPKKELRPVDHSKMDYLPFRKAFYAETKEIAALTPKEVAEIREDCMIKVRGREVAKPISTWEQAGLPEAALDLLQKRGLVEPFPIQRQALPVIMGGRDVIGVARTGSGKTLAYLLPLLRHILLQPPLAEGEGPIGLILAPARELVVQIYGECMRFGRPLGLRVTAIYGGASISEQIADMKRGSEVIVATPGRLIDLLATNAGRAMSLSRVTYVVLDEADRMFDVGFGPQIQKIIDNVRPDRQTVLFSATFPQHVESLAKRVLTAPVEIVVGGRSVSSSDVTQYVEVLEEWQKFWRLLALLGESCERGSILVFVDTKEKCDNLFAELLKSGYGVLALHGGMDQVDRDQTLADFKNGARSILVATSLAGRGLDVKELVLVINYSCPNHLEDYVHRVGRTGRAGRKGTAYTFITPQEGPYAADLIRALTDAKQAANIPAALRQLAEEHDRKVQAGEAREHASGYRTKGYKFDENESSEAAAARSAQKTAYELATGLKSLADITAEEEVKREERALQQEVDDDREYRGLPKAPATGAGVTSRPPPAPPDAATLARLKAKHHAVVKATEAGLATPAEVAQAAKAVAEAEAAVEAHRRWGEKAAEQAKKSAVEAARDAAAQIQRNLGLVGSAGGGALVEEVDVNDYPPRVLYKLQTHEGKGHIAEMTGTSILLRGTHIPKDANRQKRLDAGERPLHILIEGRDEPAVRRAKQEIRKFLEVETAAAGVQMGPSAANPGGYAKYTVV